MGPRIAMLLGRTVWVREGGAWKHETFPDGPAREPILRLAEVLAAAPPQRGLAVFEPESMSHQAVETPKVSRAAFASLARVRHEHPVVEAEDLGWGIEPPESAPGGAYATLIHAELTPGLVHVREACAQAKCPLDGAWSAYTAAVACARSRPARPGRFVLLLTPDYVAVAAHGGSRRSLRAWTGTLSERDWKTVSGVLGEFDGAAPAPADAAARRGGITAIVAGEPERSCPTWRELRDSGRIEAILDLDALALGASRIPSRHPANLTESFPSPRNLDSLLAGAAVFGLAAAVGLGSLALADRSRLGALDAAQRLRAAGLESQLKHLGANRLEMLRLRTEVPEGFGPLPLDMKGALSRLSAAIPDALTLSSFSIGIDRSFALEALVVGQGFDPQGARQALEQCGFVPGKEKGWVFESPAGRLRVQGRFGEGPP
jgi:hypothetical protein